MCAKNLSTFVFIVLFSVSSLVEASLASIESKLLCGDANLSYDVNISDALTIARWDANPGYYSGYISSLEDATAACYNADVDLNNDWRVSILDALTVARYVVGLNLLSCHDFSQRCAPEGFGGPNGGQAEYFFNQCLNQFGWNFTSFHRGYCEGDCGRDVGETETPCVGIDPWPGTGAVIPAGYILIGNGTENSCNALSGWNEIPVGYCFHGTSGYPSLTGLNINGTPVADNDCDGWSNGIESCIDGRIQSVPDFMNKMVYTTMQFSCVFDGNPRGGPEREFVLCRNS